MRPCQAAPAFDTTMSTPPKASTTVSKAARTEAASVTSQATASADPPIASAFSRAAASSTSSSATSAPAAAKARAVAAPMAPPAPVMAAIWPASGGSFARASLACSGGQYSHSNMSNSPIDWNCADRLGVGDDGDGRLGDVGGDARIGLAAAEAEQAEPRHQDDPRQRIEHDPRLPEARDVALEIGLVVGDEFARRLPRRGLEVVELAGLRRRHDQRPALGADGVVGRHHAGPGVARHLLAVDEIAHDIAGAELQHQPPPGAFDLVVGQGCRRRAGSAPPRPAARSPSAAPRP